MAHWVRQMPNLEMLDVPNSSVLDETAWEAPTLGKIKAVYFVQTQIRNEGLRALSNVTACQSQQSFSLGGCPNLGLDDGAVEALSDATSKNADGRLRALWCKIFPPSRRGKSSEQLQSTFCSPTMTIIKRE